jgi:hypothetical protein
VKGKAEAKLVSIIMRAELVSRGRHVVMCLRHGTHLVGIHTHTAFVPEKASVVAVFEAGLFVWVAIAYKIAVVCCCGRPAGANGGAVWTSASGTKNLQLLLCAVLTALMSYVRAQLLPLNPSKYKCLL